MTSRFEGQVALVTGGSNGLGRAITEAFVGEGARVGVLDLHDSGVFSARPEVVTIVGDIAETHAGPQAIEELVARWGKVDILVNDAASYPDGTIAEMPPEEWRRVFDVNVTGTFLVTQAFVRHCLGRAATGAKVVTITSGSARSPRPEGAAYAASKAALETISKVLAMEVGPHGINVNVVSPGYIDVRGWSEAFPDRASDELRASLVRSIPLGEAGAPTDIANAVLFLCSPEARHITGAVLDVDGGSLAGRFAMSPDRT